MIRFRPGYPSRNLPVRRTVVDEERECLVRFVDAQDRPLLIRGVMAKVGPRSHRYSDRDFVHSLFHTRTFMWDHGPGKFNCLTLYACEWLMGRALVETV